jgi:hypothetical protein
VLVFTYIYCVAYYNNRDPMQLNNNGFKMLLQAIITPYLQSLFRSLAASPPR